MSCPLNWYLRFSTKKKKTWQLLSTHIVTIIKKKKFILSTNASLTIIEGEFADPNVIWVASMNIYKEARKQYVPREKDHRGPHTYSIWQVRHDINVGLINWTTR